MLGEKFQILVDPVLAEIDGMAGSLMKYADTMELFADPPLTVQDLPLFDDFENPGEHKLIIVAVPMTTLIITLMIKYNLKI
jgi:hypothetical protein